MSRSSISLSPRAQAYVGVVIAVGLAVAGHSAVHLYLHPPPPHWLILAALTLLTGTFTVRIPALDARISVSEAFVLTSVLMFGAEVGTVIVAFDAMVMSFWMVADRRSRLRTLFNLSAVAFAVWSASHVFFAMVGGSPASLEHIRLAQLAGPLLVLAGLFFLINSWLVAFALAAERDQNVIALWTEHFPWLSLNYFGGASVAALLVAYTRSVDIAALGVILPLLLISYLTYRTSLGRVEDARRHVEQVNALYMSTIEALAMAVDAKDQITHGHIRRVQVYAVELAKRLGVTDRQQLQAIEAAALLHDMGKLAIPEHILNKPGKLTTAEFDKMKRHSDIGADLLASIPFPYPVVPIVRHHHENWDGTGYPNGIAGTDIPLGARILSVVDCFDALTSDRPYRPRLSAEAAFEILSERRGSMYDPLVVDAFSEAYETIAPSAALAGQQARTLITDAALPAPECTRALNEIQSGSAESAALVDLRAAVLRAHSISELAGIILPIVRRFTPSTLLVIYSNSGTDDVLRCVSTAGDPDGLMERFEIPCGERTTGWVVANRTTIVNSSASLDLGSRAGAFVPPLKTALSTTISATGALYGALTAYSTLDSPFTPEHSYILEQVAALLGERMSDSEKGHSSLLRFPDSSKGTQVRR
jgi:putative nucleotidyltransferase with HDIG domain